MHSENNDLDFYTPKKQKQDEPEPPQITTIAGLDFFTGMRFTIDGLLFEVTSHNRIQCIESYLTCPEHLKNTVFDVSGANYALFWRKMGLDMNKVRKCISEPKNGKKHDLQNPNLLINKLDLQYRPEMV